MSASFVLCVTGKRPVNLKGQSVQSVFLRILGALAVLLYLFRNITLTHESKSMVSGR